MLRYAYDHLWATLALMLTLHLCDYALTIIGARHYRRQSHLRLGSYELNPAFQADVEKLRWISPKYLLRLTLMVGLYAGVWWFANVGIAQISPTMPRAVGICFFDFVLGMMVGLLAGIIARHIQNIWLFRRFNTPHFAEGTLAYSQASSYRLSADALAVQSGLALFLAAMVPHFFFLGWALMAFALSRQHRQLAGRAAMSRGEAGPAGRKAIVRPIVASAVALLICAVAIALLLAYNRHELHANEGVPPQVERSVELLPPTTHSTRIVEAFQNAKEVTLLQLSIDPVETTGPNVFYRYPIINRTVVPKVAHLALMHELEKSVRERNYPVLCFDPRDGVRIVEKSGDVFEMLICFECSQVHYYRNGEAAGASPVGQSPEQLLHALLPRK